jgi:predicted DNA-binding protein (UPF0278 family)
VKEITPEEFILFNTREDSEVVKLASEIISAVITSDKPLKFEFNEKFNVRRVVPVLARKISEYNKSSTDHKIVMKVSYKSNTLVLAKVKK